MDNNKEIIMIKGHLPILDFKYDITKHRLYKKLGDVNDENNKNNYYSCFFNNIDFVIQRIIYF